MIIFKNRSGFYGENICVTKTNIKNDQSELNMGLIIIILVERVQIFPCNVRFS